jgi:hypothetical protein
LAVTVETYGVILWTGPWQITLLVFISYQRLGMENNVEVHNKTYIRGKIDRQSEECRDKTALRFER